MLALLAVLTIVLGACSAGPSRRPPLAIDEGGQTTEPTPSSSAATSLPPLQQPNQDSLDWTDCTAATRDKLGNVGAAKNLSFSCAHFITAADSPDQPDSGAARLALLKAGTGSVPLLVLNDVNGTPGTEYAARLAATMPQQMLKTFAFIGVDRRGTGSSDGVSCIPQNTRNDLLNYDPMSTDLTPLEDTDSSAVQQCALEPGTNLQTLDTVHTVNDVDSIRKALGVDKLNAIGHGEGSRVLASYAADFPGHAGRFVLDGAPDPIADQPTRQQSKASAAESAFDAFAADCVQRKCPLGGQPRQAVTQLLSKLRTTPITQPDGIGIGPGMAMNAIVAELPEPSAWPTLGDALGKAQRGDGSGIEQLLRPQLTGSIDDASRLDAGLITGCNDDADRPTSAQVVDWMKAAHNKAPLFGDYFAQNALLCSPWPVPTAKPPTTNGAGLPPVLVISTANDPVTPRDGTQHFAQTLQSAVLVDWQGTGHGGLPDSACATTAAQRFLVNSAVPADGMVCPP
ncbi:MAG: alpha/beta fold hydrolase [Sciscionella sp.]|nr:alpha/beta fold hydrolase [Sciscionella sp.]